MSDLVFYLFAVVLLGAAVCVVSARHPVHAVLFLILVFFNAAGLFLMLGAEYIAMTLVIVYVGAVAVLFLFVVMMLDVDFAKLRQGFQRYLPLAAALGALILVQISVALYESVVMVPVPKALIYANITNTEAIGHLLYTTYFLPFQLSGLILLVAMIGAIVLTMRHSSKVRRQDIAKQVSRTRDQGVAVVEVATGKGVEGL